MNIPSIIEKINERIDEHRGKAYIVGGAIRDHLFKTEPKDFDIEVYNMNLECLKTILADHGTIKVCGESFGVIKFICPFGAEYDFSLPRKDSKIGIGHKEFDVVVNPHMSLEEASSRRDFTINSMFYDITERRIIDLHNGMKDFDDKVLRHVSNAFYEDPLRVLRAMQFVSRFDFNVSLETIAACQSMYQEYFSLSIERIWGEWHKWATKSIKPSKGLKLLNDTLWIDAYSLGQLNKIEQDPEWHPEGNVFEHTCHTVDAAKRIAIREKLSTNDAATLMFSALCHDMGKINTSSFNEDGRISSPQHDKTGYYFSVAFMSNIGAPNEMIDAVSYLVREHMIHISGTLTPKMVRRLSARLNGKSTIKLLSHLIEADHSGRPPLPAKHPCPELIQIANELNVQAEKPKEYLMGRHLIDLGLKPGKLFGKLIADSYELQLDGIISNTEEAIEWAKRNISNEN